jgi:hypothetical protein
MPASHLGIDGRARCIQVQSEDGTAAVGRHVHVTRLACRVLLVIHHTVGDLGVGNEQLQAPTT